MASSAKILPHPATVNRAYEGAGAYSALTSWTSFSAPPDVDIHAALRALRARSRESAQNDDHMSYFLTLVESNVIGLQGIAVQARPKLLSGKFDKRLAGRIELEWTRQCKRGAWDCTGQLSRTAFDQLGVRTTAQDGEVLIRLHEGDPESPTGFSVELIDAETLDIDYNAVLPNGNVVRMGVEMTRRRRPVAYWLFSEPANPWGGYGSTYSASQRTRVPADEIIHVYLPHWVWGSRGVPWARTALRRMKMLSGYEEAAITAARMAAVKGAKYVASPDADPRQGMNGAPGPDGQFAQEVRPGQIEQVPWGWDLQALDWSWPNTEHGEFCSAALRGIACGLGIDFASVSNDLREANYSSMRHGALNSRDLWMRLQGWWIEWVSEPIYRRWVAYAIRTGRIAQVNGETLSLDRIEALSEAVYQGRRWPWVDPLKDLQASQLAVNLRTRSISSIIRESGLEPEDVWTELAEDFETLARLKIAPVAAADPPGASGPVPGAPPEAPEAPEDPALSTDPKDPEEAPPDA
jgi:lambda family phage portal protein